MPDYPQNSTPLAALPILVLDLETTGLNITRDRIVQIGAIEMTGTEITDAARIDTLVNPGIKIPAKTTKIHKIADKDIKDAEPFSAFAQQLKRAFVGRVVVGHHINFDLAILRFEAVRHHIEWRDPPALDLAMLAGALLSNLPDYSLDTVARWLEISTDKRHNALGDCLNASEVFKVLLPIMIDGGTRTLAQARLLANSRVDLMLQYEHAGWNKRPQTVADPPMLEPPEPVDRHIYSHELRTIMQSTPKIIAPTESLRNAALLMTEYRVGSLLIVDDRNRPYGIVTERDILKVAAQPDCDLDSSKVEKVMSNPVETMEGGDMLYRALARMSRKKVRHLAIVGDSGEVIGMISQRDLVRHRSGAVDVLSDTISEAQTITDLIDAHGQLPQIAANLADEGLDGIEIGRVISSELRALTAKVTAISDMLMQLEGYGPAPSSWCVFILGSAGRGESLLGADQDHALIHNGKAEDDGWFQEIGIKIENTLHEVGIPRCQGGVMSSNNQWRGSVEQWRKRIGSWVGRAQPQDLLNVDIFFDLRPAYGDKYLVRDLQSDALQAAKDTPTFINQLLRTTAEMPEPFGPLGRLKTDNGRIDLKLIGLMPLVCIARVLALRIGSNLRTTTDRLRDAAAHKLITDKDAKLLIDIYRRLMTVVLTQQLVDIERGIAPSNRVESSRLDRPQFKQLKLDLRFISDHRSLIDH